MVNPTANNKRPVLLVQAVPVPVEVEVEAEGDVDVEADGEVEIETTEQAAELAADLAVDLAEAAAEAAVEEAIEEVEQEAQQEEPAADGLAAQIHQADAKHAAEEAAAEPVLAGEMTVVTEEAPGVIAVQTVETLKANATDEGAPETEATPEGALEGVKEVTLLV